VNAFFEKNRDISVKANAVLISFSSLLLFPWLGFMFFLNDRALGSFIVAWVFVELWGLTLVFSVKLKSRFLFYAYIFYWTMAVFSVAINYYVSQHVYVIWAEHSRMAAGLFIFFAGPYFGFLYFLDWLFNIDEFFVLIFLPLIMFLAGLVVKFKFFRKGSAYERETHFF
jgi:hypothetical protein